MSIMESELLLLERTTNGYVFANHQDIIIVYTDNLLETEARKIYDCLIDWIEGKHAYWVPKGIKRVSSNQNITNYVVNGTLVAVHSGAQSTYEMKSHTKYEIVAETPALYQLHQSSKAEPEWVKAIFDGSAKEETIYIDKPGYKVLPDFKWDYNPEHLYLLIMFSDPGLRSIRDLRIEHSDTIKQAVADAKQWAYRQYKIDTDQLLCFFHYWPSAWRLHIHVQHIGSPIKGLNTQAGRAHLVEDVLRNISYDSEYYNKATLTHVREVNT